MNYKHGPVEIRPALPNDASVLRNRVRPEDAREIFAAGFKTIEEGLKSGVKNSSEAWTVLLSGSPVAIFGIIPRSLMGAEAVVWFIGSPEMGKIKKTFMRMSRLFIREWLTRYPILWNIVPKDYAKSLAWLKWLGATVKNDAVQGGVDSHVVAFERAK